MTAAPDQPSGPGAQIRRSALPQDWLARSVLRRYGLDRLPARRVGAVAAAATEPNASSSTTKVTGMASSPTRCRSPLTSTEWRSADVVSVTGKPSAAMRRLVSRTAAAKRIAGRPGPDPAPIRRRAEDPRRAATGRGPRP